MNEVPTTVATKSSSIEDFRIWLQQEFTRRCKLNSRYSLRAFARLLKMEATSVSQIFSGKRKVSTKVITRICYQLGANPILMQSFLDNAQKKANPLKKTSTFDMMTADAFSVISDWYHIALLELVNTDGFKNSPQWIGNMLNISPTQAQIALERLQRLGLIRAEGKRIVRTQKFLTNFEPGMTSVAHRQLQSQILQIALDAISNTPAEEKDITGMTMAIDIEKLPQARKLIAKFRRDLSQFLEDGHQSQIYQLAVQLFPISKNTKLKTNKENT